MILTNCKKEVFILVKECGSIFTHKHFCGIQQCQEILDKDSEHNGVKTFRTNTIIDFLLPLWHLLDVLKVFVGLWFWRSLCLRVDIYRVIKGLTVRGEDSRDQDSSRGLTVIVHLRLEPPYWKVSLFSTSGNSFKELTLPAFVMDFNEVPLKNKSLFCLKKKKTILYL